MGNTLFVQSSNINPCQFIVAALKGKKLPPPENCSLAQISPSDVMSVFFI